MTGNEGMTAGQRERGTVEENLAGAGATGGAAAGRPRFRGPARAAAAAAAVLTAGVVLVGCGGDPQPADNAAADPAPAGAAAHHGSGTGGSDGSTGGSSTGGGDNGGTGGANSESTGDGSGSTGSTGASGSSGSSDSSGSSGASNVDTQTGTQHSASKASHKKGKAGKATTACATADLKASVGPNHPGAGQENFALVFTNDSGKTCTVRGFPGLAFVDSAGDQVSYDPHREGGGAQTVTLAPGKSAWAPLSFSNPQMTGVPTVTPDSVLLTPPDQRASIKVDWTGGPVTATGKASVPKIGTLSPGTGA